MSLAVAAPDWDLALWTVVPFAMLLLGIAILPLAAERWWESNRNKLLFALACGLPVAVYMGMKAAELDVPFTLHDHPLLATLHEYAAFMLLLFALYVISGGIYIKGTLAGTPSVNAGIMAVGAAIASVVGTTGASMLLIRPLLRANRVRKKKAHIVVFFIFIVANCGGLLTPLGDPPLFLGFLHGVPFTWTLDLWKQWALVNGVLLVVFHFLDSHFFHREDVEDHVRGEPERDLDVAVEEARAPMGIEGSFNFVWLLGVIAVVYSSGRFQWNQRWPLVQEEAMLGLALLSIVTTSKSVRAKNRFSYGPIVEVACLFIGIFLAMVPALKILNAHGADLGITTARGFFWASGGLSSFLDNAPTYLTFASVAAGMQGIPAEGDFLGRLLERGPEAAKLLAAIACGSVMMGANTYIGNGPNFMVKAIAENSGIRMPSFFGYMGWSIFVLLPVFAVVTLVFF